MRISFALSLFMFGCSTSTVVAEGSMTEDAGRRPREDRPNRPNDEPAADDDESAADDDGPAAADDDSVADDDEGGAAGASGGTNEGGDAGEGPVAPPPEPEATCTSTDTLESECTNGEDEDCDGFIDC